MSKVLRIAHRGASGYEPENTLKAFNAALHLGADMIEIDVRRTRDRQLVVFHDFMLHRLTNGYGRVRRYTLHELKRFDIGGEEIPTLLEALSHLRGKCQIIIELKERGLAKDIVSAVKEYGMENDVLFSSYLHLELLKIKSYDSALRISLLFLTLPASIKTAMKLGEELRSESLTFYLKNIPRRFIVTAVKEAQARNMKVNVCTVNDPDEIQWLKNAGVHGIISDYPDRI